MEKGALILLNQEQSGLVQMPKHPMSRPWVIFGPAGSGKTLSVLAIIERLHNSGQINKDNKVLYVCENEEVHKYMIAELIKRKIPHEENIHFKNLHEVTEDLNIKSMFSSMIASYGAIFIDEAEELGISVFNNMCFTIHEEPPCPTDKTGHFWILFDFLQVSTTNAGRTIGAASAPSHGSYQVIKMNKIYRNSGRCVSWMRETPLITMYSPNISMGHNITGPNIKEINFTVKADKTNSTFIERIHNILTSRMDDILEKMFSEVLDLTTKQGVHPGDIAITFDECDNKTLFDSNKVFIQEKLNELSTAMFGKTRSNPGVAPLASSNTEDSVLHPHSHKLTDCRCKYFIGPYKRLKGMTVKVIIYVSVQGRTRGYNRMAVFTGLTRSSCSIIMFNVTVKNMEMKKYQAEKVKFFKNKYGDEGWGRQLDFSIEGAPQKQRTKCSSTNVLYCLPDGTASMSQNSQMKRVGYHSHLCNVPEGVDEEWLEGALLPASHYSQPLGVSATFVTGRGQHFVPYNQKQRNKGQRKSFLPSSNKNRTKNYLERGLCYL